MEEPSPEDRAAEQRARRFFEFLKTATLAYIRQHPELDGEEIVTATIMLAEELCKASDLDFAEHVAVHLELGAS